MLPHKMEYPRAGSRAAVFGDGSQIWVVGGYNLQCTQTSSNWWWYSNSNQNNGNNNGNEVCVGVGIRRIEMLGMVIKYNTHF